jgi:ABC-type antimicrobial peptide transport system permease subunit
MSLIIGITISVVIYTFVHYQYTFDHQHTNAERVYRVNFLAQQEWGVSYGSQTPEPLHKVLRENYPQIEAVSRTVGPMETNIFIGDNKYAQPNILFIDQYFTQLFDQEWVSGSPEEIFKDPRAVVLTESIAQKFFGTEDPIGKTLNFSRRVDGIVRGIVKDASMKTNLPFVMLAHIDMMKQIEEFYVRDSWGAMSIGTTWVLLPEKVKPESLADQMQNIITQNAEAIGPNADDIYSFDLGPLKELHTSERYGSGVNYTVGNDMIYLLVVVGAIILLTCCINFVNLSTAQALKRSKEVGVKKVLGSSRSHLSKQFFLELGILTFLAAFVSLWLAELLLHKVNQLISMVTLDLALEWESVAFTAALIIVVTLVAGLYPVGILTRFNTVEALRSNVNSSRGKKAVIRNVLLTFQFIFSQVLVILLLVFTSQFNYIKTADLGYKTDNIMMIDGFLPGGWVIQKSTVDAAKTRLMENPNIEAVSFGTGGPNAFFAWATSVKDPLDPANREINTDYKLVDIDYKDLFELEMAAGSWFTPANYQDTLLNVIVTELLVDKLGWEGSEAAIGKTLITNGRRSRIVGVLADFHTDNLKSEIRPSVFEPQRSGYNQGFIKYREGSYAEVATHFKEVARAMNPDHTPAYIDFTDELALDYEVDQLVYKFVNFTTILALIIGCLGLYSLISYIAQQKTKEIGIRKVIGANVNSLMVMLSSRFILILLIASVLATPFGYWMATIWLQGFAYSTSISPLVFVIAFLGTTLIAFGSVSYRAYKAATINPVKSLRYE